MKAYQIGELAKEAGVKADTIRFYEKLGVMPKPLLTQSGYRRYTTADLKRLRFIIRAKDMGFTLAEIKGLLDIRLISKNTCNAVYAQSENKIKFIDQKISELNKMKKALRTLMEKCHLEMHDQSECPILDALEAEEVDHE